MSNKYRVIEKIIDRPFSDRLIVANALTEEEQNVIEEGEYRTKEALRVINEIKRLHRKGEGNEEQISQYGEQLTAFIDTHNLDRDKLQMGYTNASKAATPTRMDEIKKFIFNESRDNKFKEDWRDKKTLNELVAQNRAVKNNVLKFRKQLNETASQKGGMEFFQM